MTGSAHGGPADDNDVGGVFDEPLTDHDLLVLSRAFDFSDGLREH